MDVVKTEFKVDSVNTYILGIFLIYFIFLGGGVIVFIYQDGMVFVFQTKKEEGDIFSDYPDFF